MENWSPKIQRLLFAVAFVVFGFGVSLVRVQAALPGVEVLLVLDDSASMRVNDPHGLMRTAVGRLADTLPAGSLLGVVSFADRATLLLPLSRLDALGGRGRLDSALAGITYNGRRTDIAAGVERGLYDLSQHGHSTTTRVMVLITDGVLDIGDRGRLAERARWLRGELADHARGMNIRIFGIAFTESADFELLQALAQRTSGGYYRILTASDLSPALEHIRSELDTQTVPLPLATPPVVAPQRVSVRTFPVWALVAIGAVVMLAFSVGAILRRREGGLMPGAELLDIGGNAQEPRYAMKTPVLKIGRASDNDVVIDRETVSSYHAEIRFHDGLFSLRDMKSMNGTYVNGRMISDRDEVKETTLANRDRIRVDAFEFDFLLESEHPVAKTRPANEAARKAEAGRGNIAPDRRRDARRDGNGDDVPEVRVIQNDPRGDSVEPRVGGDVSKLDERRNFDTQIKPVKCPNHKGLDARELCEKCGGVFCKYCVEDTLDGLFCHGCSSVRPPRADSLGRGRH